MNTDRVYQSAVAALALVLICLLAAGSASAAELIHYTFDGTAVNAANPGTYDGTLVNGPTYGSGQVGGGIEFNGATQYVDSGASPSTLGLNGSASRTIMGWANIAAFNNAGIFSMGSNSTVNDFSLRTRDSVNNFRAQFWGSDFDFSYNTAQNNWVHYALVYDSSTTTARVYLNGGAPTGGAQSLNVALNTTDGYNFRVGVWRTDYLVGAVDDIRVFDTALTQQQVTAYMNTYPTANMVDLVGPTTAGARVRVVAGSVSDIADANSLLINGSLPGVGRNVSSIVNFGDTNANNLFTSPAKTSYPSGTPTSNFAAEISGMLYIPSAGDYVLGVNSDDGFRLQLGNNLKTAMEFPGPTGDSDTRIVRHFDQAGYVPYRLVQFEIGGDQYVEFWSAPGADPSDLTNAALIGDTANGGLASVATGAFAVRQVQSTGTISSLAAAEALLAGTGVAESASTYVDVLDYHDATNTNDHYDVDNPFLLGTGDDNFAVEATTRLLITEAGTYTFGARTDDGSALMIDGQVVFFDDVLSDLHDVFGSIELTAGLHDLRYVFFERNGGAALELFAAKGDLTSFDASAFALVGDVANGGIAVFAIPTPAAAPMALCLLAALALKRRR
ncbi:hypothetical protein HED60_20855 [Planctomycetales bacterium ZRK34]|nr:hypothetical protein HED60_20855 [Planctomycetales bacterium ZRK34]